MHHWHITVHPALTRPPGFHKFGSLEGQQIWSCPGKHQSDHVRFCNQKEDRLSWSSPPQLSVLDLNPWWSFLLTPDRWFMKRHCIPSFQAGWLFRCPCSLISQSRWGHSMIREGCHHLAPGEGPGAMGMVEWETTRVDSFWVEGTWGRMFRRVEACFPWAIGWGQSAPHGLLEAGL